MWWAHCSSLQSWWSLPLANIVATGYLSWFWSAHHRGQKCAALASHPACQAWTCIAISCSSLHQHDLALLFSGWQAQPLGAAHLEMSILSSQCFADPDVFSSSSASRSITRLRNHIYFCIWCIMAYFHINSAWALICLKEHLPLQSIFFMCFH